MNRFRFLALAPLLAVSAGCASLGVLGSAVQAPTFEVAPGRQAELRLLTPSLQNPVGGITVRLWARVGNPNPLGLVLSALNGNLALEGTQAAQVSFPLGLPLPAQGDTVIPLDFNVSFTNIPRLADVVTNGMTRGSVGYRLSGTAAVDAGLLGQPSFGPMTLLQGAIDTRR